MSTTPEPSITVRVDPTNPGQFFACCGLLELADRLWDGGAEGWFRAGSSHFCIRAREGTTSESGALLVELARCKMTNAMTTAQLSRREALAAMSKRAREDAQLEDEKKGLDSLWRESAILFGGRFGLRVDWFLDTRAGGSVFKTWAGQQSVVDIACGMKAPLAESGWKTTAPQDWLFLTTGGDSLPFNFDSALGGLGSDRDVGFSFDPLKEISVRTRPVVELAAFVGLQRFRPERTGRENRYRFSLWFTPLIPGVAAAAAAGLVDSLELQTFEFRLLYRTKYLKSFLPANPVERRIR